jgi:hypothetical protein
VTRQVYLSLVDDDPGDAYFLLFGHDGLFTKKQNAPTGKP